MLTANSYHEFTKPLAILDHAFRALHPSGRLVVLDRAPRSYQGESRETQMQRFQIAVSIVEDEIRRIGFEVISREDCFLIGQSRRDLATVRMITFGDPQTVAGAKAYDG